MQLRNNKSYGTNEYESKIYKNVVIDEKKVVIQTSGHTLSFIYPNTRQEGGETGLEDFIKFEKYVNSITKPGGEAKFVYNKSMGAGLKLLNDSLEC
jgi:hypothetical protein